MMTSASQHGQSGVGGELPFKFPRSRVVVAQRDGEPFEPGEGLVRLVHNGRLPSVSITSMPQLRQSTERQFQNNEPEVSDDHQTV